MAAATVSGTSSSETLKRTRTWTRTSTTSWTRTSLTRRSWTISTSTTTWTTNSTTTRTRSSAPRRGRSGSGSEGEREHVAVLPLYASMSHALAGRLAAEHIPRRVVRLEGARQGPALVMRHVAQHGDLQTLAENARVGAALRDDAVAAHGDDAERNR